MRKMYFEYIYFARPDSYIDGVGVYSSRIMAGRILAKTHPVEADIVVGVPESGNVAALGYSMESGIPYGIAFMKNSYVGRTFIKPKQSQRETSVKIKLNVLKDAVNGKRVIMIDDSIVRGTTSARIVKMLKDAGATEVHVRISSPPFLHPCYFGTDIPSDDQLIAHDHTVDQICKYIGADSLGYLDVTRLSELIDGKTDYCDACFTGNYPIEPPTEDIRGEYENKGDLKWQLTDIRHLWLKDMQVKKCSIFFRLIKNSEHGEHSGLLLRNQKKNLDLILRMSR